MKKSWLFYVIVEKSVKQKSDKYKLVNFMNKTKDFINTDITSRTNQQVNFNRIGAGEKEKSKQRKKLFGVIITEMELL